MEIDLTQFDWFNDDGIFLPMINDGQRNAFYKNAIDRSVIRKAEDKDFVQIWDITSTCKFAKRHLTKRKQFYQEANYPFIVEKTEWQ